MISNVYSQLWAQFTTLQQQQFSGQIVIADQAKGSEPKHDHWIVFFYAGRILYATGGRHSTRRWVRHLSRYCPDQTSPLSLLRNTVKKRKNKPFASCWECEVIYQWANEGRITRDQGIAVITAIISEVFFELYQVEGLHIEEKSDPLPTNPLCVMKGLEIVQRAYQDWQNWQSSPIKNLSPSSAPIIRNHDELKSQTSSQLYKVLVQLLNGERTFQDIALVMKKDFKAVMQALYPYIQTECIGLVQLADLPTSAIFKKSKPEVFPESSLLIACIDDSPAICKTMESILTKANYQVVSITDPMRAMVKLLGQKPDLIFLDLVMPNTNGYEICSKLRNLSVFKEVPIVILTGQDGLVDRLKAKMVGASDFLAKPIIQDTVLETVSKFLPKAVNN